MRICTACGVQQFEEGPEICPICADERQFAPVGGQQWTDAETLQATHKVVWREEAPGVRSLIMDPQFGIGQRAFLIEHPEGNVLWDCISLLDHDSWSKIAESGGLKAIAISHPHFYSAIAEWGRAFHAPAHVHADDAQWILQPDDMMRPWDGETLALPGGMTMIRCGGHFAGAAVLHVPHLNGGRGALFSGDTLQVVPDRAHVSFMRSYPNLIPLNAATVRRIVAAVEPYEFDAIYGAFPGRTIVTDAKAAIRRSEERYVRAITDGFPQAGELS